MVSSRIYIEGGRGKALDVIYRRAFRKLFERCQFSGRMPKLVTSGSRGHAYSDFKTAYSNNASSKMFIAMLVDSEDPVVNIEKTWDHLKNRDNWDRPVSADDQQVLLMTTSMETWVVADQETLRRHYGAKLTEAKLPSLHSLEDQDQKVVFGALKAAMKDHTSPYTKGRNSFEGLGQLNPDTLKKHLPSFNRVLKILEDKL